MAGSEDTPAGTARGAGEVPEWVPVSPGGVNLLQVYELLALTPTERAQKLAQTVNALARMKAATRPR